MAKILVAGLSGLETSLGIDQFPLGYFPVCFPFNRVKTVVSGAAYNVAASLVQLGHSVNFCTLLGTDLPGKTVMEEMQARGLSRRFVCTAAPESSQSVILYEPSGRRQIHCDLKNLQELTYPLELYEEALEGVDMVCLGTMNFCRPLLGMARDRKIPLASDIHAVDSLEDQYHLDFYRGADILFMSHEKINSRPENWLTALRQRWGTKLAVMGCGENGAWMIDGAEGDARMVPAVSTRPVINTIGAGDALFASFIDGYLGHGNPHKALREATVYAAWKIGESGASQGFPDRTLWHALCQKHL